ncbi:Astacin-like metalloendopeptidase [Strongyloides ratti]|uniref:Metalloendopeptidase n=1 Tax=Strongyloides ratti TaxID=34506 RepID=A0A090LKI9_STRRB|nr:Astacin-like metalloendopeptidase [Strongyloides ratti]CEF70332.1 Astacin-like metalloendopeptidase [Strongyloides ratti]
MLRIFIIFQIIIYHVYTYLNNISSKDFMNLRRKRQILGRAYNYFIDPTVNFPGITQAINFYRTNTCTRWQLVNTITPTTDVAFLPGPNCSSTIGMDPNNLPHVIFVTQSCSQNGNMQREIAHALGLFNEEVRPDRDNFISVLYQNVIPNNFGDFTKNNLNIVGPNAQRYDYGSLMHSDLRFNSRNGRPTLQLKYPKFLETTGQKISLSFNDLKLINTELCNQCPIRLPCRFGGYTYEGKCNACTCPVFHGGRLCQRVRRSRPSCGNTNLHARSVPNSFTIRGIRNCFYKIRAGVGFLVKLTINEALLPGGRCWRNKGIEARVFEDKALSGVRLCGYVFNEVLKSKANGVIIQYKGARPYHFMRITYVRVKD